MMKRNRIWTLFSSMLLISAFTFGGGFVIVSLMKKKFVDELCWLTEEEMLDMTALAQSAPGPIAVNAAILVGRRVAGWPGMLAAVLGTLIPPVVIIGTISLIYAQFAANEWVRAAMSGMSCGVAAVICDVVAGLGKKVFKSRDGLNIALMLAAFVLTYFLKVNVVFIILGAAAIGAVRAALSRKGGDAA
ncbi:MAG: chromate transporter [Clostridia bacterium]|nr:chromate transporter [Clostridia bacterium]